MWHYCRVIVHMAYQKIQSNYGLSAYIFLADHDYAA